MRCPAHATKPVAYATLVLLACALYANTLQHQWVRDDYELILRCNSVKKISNIPEFFVSPYFPPDQSGASPRYYRPLVSASFTIDYAIGGPDHPEAFHFTNVALYAACVAAAFALFSHLIPSRLGAFFAGLLFAAHAIHTESVAWISGRTDVMSALFMCLAMVAVLRARHIVPSTHPASADEKNYRKWRWLLVGAFAAMLLALFCKEVAFALLPLYVVLEISAPATDTQAPKLRRFAPGLALLAAAAVYMAMRWFALSGVETRAGTRLVTPWHPAGLATVANCVVQYVGKLALPLNLSADFEVLPFETIRGLGPLLALTGALALLVVTIYATFRNWRVGLTLWLMWFSLAPVLHIVPIAETVAERFAFVPSIGFCAILGLAADRILRARSSPRRHAAVAVGAMIALAAAHGAITVQRNPDWHNDRTLSISSVNTAPHVPRSHLSLGMVYENQKLYRRASLHYRRAAELAESLTLAGQRGQMPTAYLRLAVCARKMEELKRALTYIETAVRRNPHNPALLAEKAKILEQLASRQNVQQAWPAAYVANGRALALSGRVEEAEKSYRAALARDPQNYEAHLRLAELHSRRGALREALREAQKALKINRTPEARKLIERIKARLRNN